MEPNHAPDQNTQNQIHNFLKQQKQIFLFNKNSKNSNLHNSATNINHDTNQNSQTPSPSLNIQNKQKKTQNNIVNTTPNLPTNNQSDLIKICTHNVRGINRTTDQNNILQECKRQKIDIIGLSETKLNNISADFSFKDQNEYKKFFTCDDNSPSSAGIIILVHKTLAKNIHQVKKTNGHILTINFLFKGRKKLSITQVYLPNNKQESEKYQKQIHSLIRKEKSINTHCIVMGDFNAVNNPIEDRSNNSSTCSRSTSNTRKKRWRPEIQLFPILKDLNLIDVQKS